MTLNGNLYSKRSLLVDCDRLYGRRPVTTPRDIQIQRAPEALYEIDHAYVGYLARKPSLLDQVRSDALVDDAEHLTHDGPGGS